MSLSDNIYLGILEHYSNDILLAKILGFEVVHKVGFVWIVVDDNHLPISSLKVQQKIRKDAIKYIRDNDL